MHYTKEDLLGLIADFRQEHQRLPTAREMRALYKVCDKTFARVFGSWNSALTEYAKSAIKFSQPSAKEAPPEEEDALHPLLKELGTNLSAPELKALVDSTRRPQPGILPLLPVGRKESGYFKVLFFTDTHIGHRKFSDSWYYEMLEHAVAEGCEWAWHAGDILEGMSGRPGHVYELSEIGFEAQFAKAVKLFGDCPFPIRGITGNHDLWYAGKGDMGINVGQRLQEALPGKFVWLGDEEADEEVAGIRVKLWHGRDGSSYATSYRTQKFVEGLTGGEKPHILLSGHAHKAIFHECRNVQVIEGGTLCAQTGFMRGKKLAAHTGYWILEVWTGDEGLLRIKPEWNPFYGGRA